MVSAANPHEPRVQQQVSALIVRHIRESVIVTNLQGEVTYWNDGATAIFGYAAREMLGRTLAPLYPDPERATLEEDLAAIKAGRDHVGEWWGRRKDGTPIWLEVTTTRLLDEEGAVIGFLGLARDITARKETEEQHRLLAGLLALADDAIIVRAPDGTIIRWNAGAEALYGWTAAEAVGRITHDLLRTRVLDRGSASDLATAATGKAIDAALAAEHAWAGTLEHTRRDGVRLVVESRQALLRDEHGAPVAILEINRDLTARETLLAGLAHDFKTPLTAILGHAQLAARQLVRLSLPATEPIGVHLAQVEASARSLARLVDELVDIARLRMGAAIDLHRRPADLVALTHAVVAQQQGLTSHHLAVESDVREVEALLDAPRMERVLGNLLTNAIKYSPDGSGITVRLALAEGAHGPGVRIAVRDQGVGIPAADLPRIFDRFYRARNVTDTVPGTGLGLAIARAVVAGHGGTLSVQSAEGEGTTMEIWLSRIPSAPADGDDEGQPRGEGDDGER